MELFLQIVGGIVVTIVLLIVGVFLFLRMKFGKALAAGAGKDHTPLLIHLNEDFSPEWMEQKKAKASDGELIRLGFERGKSYSVPEMSDLRLTAYFKAPLTAVLYQHEIVGGWVEFTVEDESGGEITVTDGPMGEAVERPPEKAIEYLKDHSLEQMFKRISARLDRNASYKAITPETFREIFEQSYRKDMAYRARNGGISHEEFLRHVGESGKKMSEKQMREAFVITKGQELDQWSDAALEEYVNTQPEDERSNWYEGDAYFFIVPFATDPEAFIQYLEQQGFVESGDEEKLGAAFRDEKDIFKLFDRLNEARSPELRAVQIGESDYPLHLKIYRCKYL